MTTNLTTEQVEAGFALYLYDYHNIVIEYGKKRFQEWLAERDAEIEAAAEQRGAEAAWDEVADNLGEYAEVDDSLIHLADNIRDGNPYRADQEGDDDHSAEG